MSLDGVIDALGWPSREEILHPSGSGASVQAQTAQIKLGRAVSLLEGGNGADIGILASDPETTDAPLAIVCEFRTPVPPKTLLETQKLAWNFCRSPLLITIEPHIVRKWSCCEMPLTIPTTEEMNLFDQTPTPGTSTPEILPSIEFDPTTGRCLDVTAARSLAWIELISGHFFEVEAHRFPLEQRADRMLLRNLKEVRQKLRDMGLQDTYSHDLLARIIFVQFLFDRKDSDGNAALNPEKLLELHSQGTLSNSYDNLASLLGNYDDTYALFQWLNSRFNGDLFPGKGRTPELQREEWNVEKQHVRPEHLLLLADFIRGDLEMSSGQFCLWPQYAFDAIPLEFISSIYEEFVKESEGTGIHYTRDFVVDLMLDRVLPWTSDEWDIKIIDPACGSGIFLVKAFQRLIYRWKFAHRDQEIEISSETLRYLLENCITGIDKDPNAVRVASFSLYLAMCDEIDPRYYWDDAHKVQFPVLRNRRIIHADFFDETSDAVNVQKNANNYDLVIGNPPWGDGTLDSSEHAQFWAKNNEIRVANNDIGILFLIKGLRLTKSGGHICLIQSASALLYNQENTAIELRRSLFLTYARVEYIINLAAYSKLSSYDLFRNVRVPTCIFIGCSSPADGSPFWYECPKPHYNGQDLTRIIIDQHDIHSVYPEDIFAEPSIWATLMWGGNRDRSLVQRLTKYQTLEQLKVNGFVKTREGINYGDRQKYEPQILDKRLFKEKDFPFDQSLQLHAEELEVNRNAYIHSKDSSDFSAFSLPQLLIKAGWRKRHKRFQARLVDSNDSIGPVISSQSYLSVHAMNTDLPILEHACLVYNSSVANYFLLLTSGRFAFDRAEPLAKELRSVPLPLRNTQKFALPDTVGGVDDLAYELFGFNGAERILIEDMVNVTLPDYKEGKHSPGRLPTQRVSDDLFGTVEPELSAYAEVFRRVIKAGFGDDKQAGAIIYTERDNNAHLPVRFISVVLNSPAHEAVRIEPIASDELSDRLVRFYKTSLSAENRRAFYERTARAYDIQETNEGTCIIVTIIKPDQARYWTRSMAMRDADEIAADFMSWYTIGTPLEVAEQPTCG